jgi:uncharacterized protein (TIGR00661 family)
MKMKLSIIIPTYNEEEYLPNLLESIKKQNFSSYEIIVADNNSNDNTVKIAEEYGCKIVEGGLPGIGRNNGAKIAKGDILLFLDSDLRLTPNYLEDLVSEFEGDNLGIGITQMTPMSERHRDKFLHDLANWFMIAAENIKPHGAGCYGIVSKRYLHEMAGGFDETLTFGEDTDYIERLAKLEEFKVLRKPRICVSTRRLEEEGLYSLLKTYGKSTFNDFRGKRTSAEELNYGFGHDPITPLEKNDLDKIAEKSKHNFKKGRFHHKHSLNRHDKSSKNLINKEKSQSLSRIRHDTQNKKLKQEIVKKEEMPPSTKRKRIFYSVCGEGMGHAIRSGVIIEELIKHHEVYIFSSNRAYEYLNGKFDNVFEIGGFNTVYENNKVRNKKTFFNAVKTNPTNLKEGYDVLYKQSQKVKPNLIISDFENYASMLSKLINVPLISLDNIHMITQTEYDYPPKHQVDMIVAMAVVKAYILRPEKHILTSFFYPPLKHPEMTAIYPPVIRNEIMKLKPEEGNHIVVYQTSDSNIQLMENLKEIDENFIVYGFNKDKVDENLTYRSFNEDIIYEDMRTAKAILTNGGFTMISEAIYLKKPVYSIPAIGNFEQILNGFYVEKLGYGEYHTKLNNKLIKSFIKNLPKYHENLIKVKNTDNSAILNEVERDIQKYSKDY